LSDSESTSGSGRKAWAAALMPIALHDLNNATQFLSMLHSVASSDPESEILESSASNLARTGEGVEDLGLLMAILSTVAGSDLLLERRSERGVIVVLAAVQKLVRKGGRDLIFEGGADQVATQSDGMSWELPWAVGSAAWLSAMGLEAGEALSLSFDSGAWSARCNREDEIKRHATSVAEVAPLIEFTSGSGAWKLSPPTEWLQP
jgi:hypothetical protein